MTREWYAFALYIILRKSTITISQFQSNDYSDKENDITDTGIESSTTVTDLLDGDATDISMSESITFDSCSLSEDAATDVACSSEESSPTHKAVTLPSKLDVKNIDWDEIDDLLQVNFISTLVFSIGILIRFLGYLTYINNSTG